MPDHKKKHGKGHDSSGQGKHGKGGGKKGKPGLGGKNKGFDPLESLSGKQLKRFVNSIVRSQTRPQIQAYKSQAQQLQDQLSQQVGQQQALGEQAGTNIRGYYQQLAQSEAQSLARQEALGGLVRGRVAQGVQGAGEAIGKAGEAALAAQERDAQLRQQQTPTSAREALQQMIVQQSGQQAREGQYLNYAAGQQANDWQGALQMQSQAAQQQGGATLTDTSNRIAMNIANLQQQYGGDIRSALEQAATAQANRGDLRRSALMDAIKSERDFALSKAATHLQAKTQRQAHQLGEQTLKAQKKGKTGQMAAIQQYKKLARLKASLSRKGQSLTAKQNKQLARLHAKLSRKYQITQQGNNIKLSRIHGRQGRKSIAAGRKGSAGGGGKGFSQHDKRRAIDIARSSIHFGKIKSKKDFQQAVGYLTNRGVDPEAARYVLRRHTPWGRNRRAMRNYGHTGGHGHSAFHHQVF